MIVQIIIQWIFPSYCRWLSNSVVVEFGHGISFGQWKLMNFVQAGMLIVLAQISLPLVLWWHTIDSYCLFSLGPQISTCGTNLNPNWTLEPSTANAELPSQTSSKSANLSRSIPLKFNFLIANRQWKHILLSERFSILIPPDVSTASWPSTLYIFPSPIQLTCL